MLSSYSKNESSGSSWERGSGGKFVLFFLSAARDSSLFFFSRELLVKCWCTGALEMHVWVLWAIL